MSELSPVTDLSMIVDADGVRSCGECGETIDQLVTERDPTYVDVGLIHYRQEPGPAVTRLEPCGHWTTGDLAVTGPGAVEMMRDFAT